MSEPVKICIVIEGGAFHAVMSGGVPVEVVILDYDTEGAAPSEITMIPQCDGTEKPAHLSWCNADADEAARAFTLQAFTIADGGAEPEGESRFLNHYECDRCWHEWSDEWSCACDDDCPACGARHMSPKESEEIDG